MPQFFITLSDGKERELKRFTLGSGKRLFERTGKNNLQEMPLEALVFELLKDKDGLDPDQIADYRRSMLP